MIGIWIAMALLIAQVDAEEQAEEMIAEYEEAENASFPRWTYGG